MREESIVFVCFVCTVSVLHTWPTLLSVIFAPQSSCTVHVYQLSQTPCQPVQPHSFLSRSWESPVEGIIFAQSLLSGWKRRDWKKEVNPLLTYWRKVGPCGYFHVNDRADMSTEHPPLEYLFFLLSIFPVLKCHPVVTSSYCITVFYKTNWESILSVSLNVVWIVSHFSIFHSVSFCHLLHITGSESGSTSSRKLWVG